MVSVDVMADEVRRALSAYFRSGSNMRPNLSESGLEQYEGKIYICLRSGSELLAAYRLRNDNTLKRLKRYPKGMIQE